MTIKNIQRHAMKIIEASNKGLSYLDEGCMEHVHDLADEAAAIHTMCNDVVELHQVLTELLAAMPAPRSRRLSAAWDKARLVSVKVEV